MVGLCSRAWSCCGRQSALSCVEEDRGFRRTFLARSFYSLARCAKSGSHPASPAPARQPLLLPSARCLDGLAPNSLNACAAARASSAPSCPLCRSRPHPHIGPRPERPRPRAAPLPAARLHGPGRPHGPRRRCARRRRRSRRHGHCAARGPRPTARALRSVLRPSRGRAWRLPAPAQRRSSARPTAGTATRRRQPRPSRPRGRQRRLEHSAPEVRHEAGHGQARHRPTHAG
jgi:hypothetical protein